LNKVLPLDKTDIILFMGKFFDKFKRKQSNASPTGDNNRPGARADNAGIIWAHLRKIEESLKTMSVDISILKRDVSRIDRKQYRGASQELSPAEMAELNAAMSSLRRGSVSDGRGIAPEIFEEVK